MVRYLLIVARTEPDLWRYLKDNFAGDQKVEVILDRRRAERRRQPGIDKDLTYRFLVIVRQRHGLLKETA